MRLLHGSDCRMHRLHRPTNRCYSSSCYVTAAGARCRTPPLQLLRLEAVVCKLYYDGHIWCSTYKEMYVFTVMTE